ncbi:hypothetical protein Moror_13734 [Moniliophthora roreri MCA 2997]|uniref:Uncharacterized protein n=1 Tax=Moniliophthora roreri (strain MCA 2997) TaxID=1381753 RepID=V2XC10_MONRO|nr:hypothetical protein Moror_13734 [Moniliophthora roreri MCA 2997]
MSEVAKLLKTLPNLASDLDSAGVLRATLPFNGQIDLDTFDSENFLGSIAVLDPAALQASVKSVDQKEIAENVISVIAGIPKANADDKAGGLKKRKRGTAKKPRKPRAPQPSGTGGKSSSKRRKTGASKGKQAVKSTDMTGEEGSSNTEVAKPVETPPHLQSEEGETGSGTEQGVNATTVAKPSANEGDTIHGSSSSRGRKRKVVSPIASSFLTAPGLGEGSAKTARYATRSVTKRLGK